MDWNIAPLLSDPAAWAALITLVVMEVVLGIDNLIFISILTNKLPEAQRQRARRICLCTYDLVGPIRNGGIGTANTALAWGQMAAANAATAQMTADNAQASASAAQTTANTGVTDAARANTRANTPLETALAGSVRILADRLALKPGDRFRLGGQDFVLMARLVTEPDAGSAGMAFGARSVVALSALERTPLLDPGSLYETKYRLTLPEGETLPQLKSAAVKRFEGAGMRWTDERRAAPSVERFTDQLGSFLVLVGLALAVLTAWHWRHQIGRRHIAVPMLIGLVGLASSIFMGGNDRALLITLPALAVLAAFALPTLQRSLGSAIDWFSVCFFTACAAAIWLAYVAVQTGTPARTAANVLKLVPDAEVPFSAVALAVALAGTLVWLWLVRWRTSRRSHALWKSLVLPAGGVALCWLLLMTLLLPLLDQARSYRLLMSRISPYMPRSELVCAPGASVGLLTGMEYFGGYQVNGLPLRDAPKGRRGCGSLVLRIQPKSQPPVVPGWRLVAQYNQRTRNSELVVVYRRHRGGS